MTFTSNASLRRPSALRTLLGGLLIALIAGTSGAALAEDTAAIRCAQKQLNTLGFEAGLPDGIVGVKTFLAGEMYIRYMTANAGKGWKQPSLSSGTAALWCEKVAQAHPRLAPHWKMYQQLVAEAEAAANPDPQKIFEMGHKFETGQGGVLRNEALAFKWYSRAAKLGHVLAQRNLGEMYHYGQGVTADRSLARHWFLLAAMQGDAESQYMIGRHHSATNDISMEWLWKAAQSGHRAAIGELERRLDI